MRPSERRDARQELRGIAESVAVALRDSMAEVKGVPANDDGGKEVQAGYAEMLALQCHLALSRNRPVTGRAGAVCGVGEGSPVAIRSMVGVERGFWSGFPRHWSMAPRLVPAGRPVGVADLLLAPVHEREHPFRASGRGLMQPLVRSETALPRAMPKRTGANPVHSLGRPRHESVRDAAPQDGMFLHRLRSLEALSGAKVGVRVG